MNIRVQRSISGLLKIRGPPAFLWVGPTLFVLALVAPVDIEWRIRGAIGLVAWILVWLVTRCIRLEVTFLLPVVVVSVIPLAPWWSIVSIYWDPLVLFIIGAVGIIMGWQYWGFTERVAIRSLLLFGTGRKRQIMVWFGLSAIFSAVIPDTIVAAMLVPIAATVLNYQGYETIEDRQMARYASLVLLAIGWGAAVGGSATPLGGGMNILTIELLSEYIGRPIPFHRWLYHLLPFAALNALVVGGYLYFVFDVESDSSQNPEQLYRRKLQRLGRLGRDELLVVGAWLLAFVVVFSEPVYAGFFDGLLAQLDPLLVFPLVFVALFMVPAKSSNARALLNQDALRAFPLPVLLIWPGAIGLARILIESGTIDLLGQFVSQYLFVSLTGVLMLGAVTVLVTNLTTNTAAAAALVPLVIGITAEAGLPVAGFAYIVVGMLNISYGLPSANGCLAVSTGFGANVTTLIRHGTVLCVLNLVVATGYFWFALSFVPGWIVP